MKPCYTKLAGLALISVLAAQSQADDLIDDQARVLSFQAGLTDGKGVPLSGPHTLTFNIYDDPEIPAPLPDGGPFNINVDIPAEANGVVSVLLPDNGMGLNASLFSGSALYLGLAVDGGVELTPRIQIASVPYSMRTNFVGNIELIDDAAFGDSSTSGSVDVYDDASTVTINLDGAEAKLSSSGSLEAVDFIGGNTLAEMTTNTGGGVFRTFDDNGNEALEAGTSTSGAGGFVILRKEDTSLGLVLDGHVPGKGGAAIGYTSIATRSFYLEGDDGDAAGRFTFYDGTALENQRVRIDASGFSGGSDLHMWNSANNETITMYSSEENSALIALWNDLGVATLGLDADGQDNGALIRLRNGYDEETIIIDASRGTALSAEISLRRPDGVGGPGSMIETVEIKADETGTEGGVIRIRDVAGNTTIKLDGDYNGTGVGRVITDVLEIQGGGDLSENFDIKKTTDPIVPGMIVCIDENHAGRLQISSEAYDRKVAGIVSGAGGVHPGMLMGQTGSIANGQHPIALSGRVYCLVDTKNGSVRPGDLLTTSDTPGHAMKVSDHSRAQGAVLGKAMSGLEDGKGMVLVLVTLQ